MVHSKFPAGILYFTEENINEQTLVNSIVMISHLLLYYVPLAV